MTTTVSDRKIIWTIDNAVMKYLAPISITSILSAIKSTGRNISAKPTGIEGAISCALGTANKCKSGTNAWPSQLKTGVYSAIIKPVIPAAAINVNTLGRTLNPSFKLNRISLYKLSAV